MTRTVLAQERKELKRQGWWQRGTGWAAVIVVCSLYALACLVPLFYGILAFEVKCGDDCGNGPSWTEDAEAWQWIPMGLLGVGVFVAALLLLAGVVMRAGGLARGALAANAVCWLGLVGLALTGT